jgi:hypothetical protein
MRFYKNGELQYEKCKKCIWFNDGPKDKRCSYYCSCNKLKVSLDPFVIEYLKLENCKYWKNKSKLLFSSEFTEELLED